MERAPDEVAQAQLLLDALFLADTSAEGVLGDAPLEWITEWLGLAPHEYFGRAVLQHLVAVQLAPRGAIAYSTSNPTPRWRLIDRYLASRFPIDAAQREHLARTVSSVLDRAAVGRGRVLLTPPIAGECAICRLPFRGEAVSLATCDPYKPVWEAPDELMRPEIDHIVAISSLGAHELGNLQVVCRACNLAKGAGLVVDYESETRYADVDLAAVPRIHRFRLLQWVIRHDGGRCTVCSRGDGELTMRPVHPDAPLVRSAMSTRCYDCVSL
jgi:5-methylcytosine-specific restriction endonuclease McrA